MNIILFRTLIHDGRMPISSDTLMKNFNNLLSKINFGTRVTTKCFKILGVSTAFRCRLSTEEVRILGRWKSLESVQHYRHTLPWTLIEMSSNLTLKSISLAVDKPTISNSTQTNQTDTRANSALEISFKYAQVYVEASEPSNSPSCSFSEPSTDICSTVPTAHQITNSSKSYNSKSIRASSVISSVKTTCSQTQEQIFDPPIIRVPFKKKTAQTVSCSYQSKSVSDPTAAPKIFGTTSASLPQQPKSSTNLVTIKEIKSDNFSLKDHDYI